MATMLVFWIVPVPALAQVVWQKDFTGLPLAMATNAAGDVVVTGTRTMLLRGSDGSTVWEPADLAWNDPYVMGGPLVARALRAVAVDAAGDVVLTGYVWAVGPGYVARTLKRDGVTGSATWDRSFSPAATAGQTSGQRMALDAHGVSVGGIQGSAWLLARYASDGSPVWALSDYNLTAIATDAVGNTYAAGPVVDAFFNSPWGYRVEKRAAADGAVVWSESRTNTYPLGMALDANGNVIVLRHEYLATGRQFVVRKVSNDGALVWETVIPVAQPVPAAPSLQSVHGNLAVDTQGNVIATATLLDGNSSTYFAQTLKLSPSGALQWTRRYETGFEAQQSVDAQGNVVVGSHNYQLNRGVVLKYTPDGALALIHTTDDMFRALATTNGAIYVATSSGSAHVGWSMRVTKLADEPDTFPDEFTFTTNRGAAPGSTQDSAPLTPAGFAAPAAITVNNGSYSLGCTGVYTAAAGTIMPGQSVCVRHTASPQYETATVSSLTISGLTGTFISLTRSRVASDLDNDGRSDLVLASSDGAIAIFRMSGALVLEARGVLPGATGWSVTHVADFDGDGKADILLRHTDGRVLLWLMDGVAPRVQTLLQPVGTGWTATHVADLNGDQKADILWEHTDGTVVGWLMDGNAFVVAKVFQAAGSGWHVTHTADLNRDGNADIFWQHINGASGVWFMQGLLASYGAGLTSAGSGWSLVGTGPSVAAAGYPSGAGNTLLAWRNENGASMVWIMDGSTSHDYSALQPPGSPWQIALVGDLDGDGNADLVWRNATDGSTYATLMWGRNTLTAGYLMPPASGWTATHLLDLNGDGKRDIMWRYTDGSVAAWLMDGVNPISGAGLVGPSTWQVVPAQLAP